MTTLLFLTLHYETEYFFTFKHFYHWAKTLKAMGVLSV